jgi:4-amino-4-deoxy-L-arabinose transferase-like glycosyltransferase
MATESFHRTAPFWYYLPIVPVAAFPWIVPALARIGSWRAAWRARREPWAREPLWLTSWVIVPLVFLSMNQSKLPQYVLPLMPACALGAARSLVMGGIHAGARAYAGVAAVLGGALVALSGWMPAAIPLTPAEEAAIPPTAAALGVVALGSAALVAIGALTGRRRPQLTVLGYAVVVMAIPLASGRLLSAVGEDRSAAALAAATAAALDRTGGKGAVLGVLAYPPSLPFYLGRTIAVATPTGAELTSNYIADYHERYRGVLGSPLLPEGYWREALARCPVPTVFVTKADNHDVRAALAALPLVATDGRYAVYGPCQPPQPRPPPRRPPRRGGARRG